MLGTFGIFIRVYVKSESYAVDVLFENWSLNCTLEIGVVLLIT